MREVLLLLDTPGQSDTATSPQMGLFTVYATDAHAADHSAEHG